MDDKAQFADWRRLLKVTQADLAHILNVCERSVRRMEKGTVPIQKSHFVHLRKIFEQCWFPSSLSTLETVLGNRVYMGREWRDIANPRWRFVLIKSTKLPKRLGVVVYDTLGVIEYEEERDTTYDSLESVSSIYNSRFSLLFEDKWPEKWKRHPAK